MAKTGKDRDGFPMECNSFNSYSREILAGCCSPSPPRPRIPVWIRCTAALNNFLDIINVLF